MFQRIRDYLNEKKGDILIVGVLLATATGIATALRSCAMESQSASSQSPYTPDFEYRHFDNRGGTSAIFINRRSANPIHCYDYGIDGTIDEVWEEFQEERTSREGIKVNVPKEKKLSISTYPQLARLTETVQKSLEDFLRSEASDLDIAFRQTDVNGRLLYYVENTGMGYIGRAKIGDKKIYVEVSENGRIQLLEIQNKGKVIVQTSIPDPSIDNSFAEYVNNLIRRDN